MPHVDTTNLTSLSARDLRQQLDYSRARGDAGLSYRILQEMAARRDAPPAERRAPEPRTLEVEIAKPVKRKARDRREPLELVLEAPEAEADLDAPPAPGGDALRLGAAEAQPKPRPAKRPHRALWITCGFALGISSGVTAGWWASTLPRVEASTARAAPREMAKAAMPAPVVAAPVAPAPIAAPPAEDYAALPDFPLAPPEAVKALPQVELAKAVVPAATASGCANEVTPADREICADPELKKLRRELQRAYAEALQAHQDRGLLRERQLAWRDARSGVSDHVQLARLYELRIEKLNAAAEAARAER